MRTTRTLLAALALALAPAGRAQAAPVDRETRLVRPHAVQAAAADSIRYADRVTDANLVGMTITNYGFIGNNFVSRSPSLEYPLGSAFEHLVRGGLWIGGRALDDTGFFTGGHDRQRSTASRAPPPSAPPSSRRLASASSRARRCSTAASTTPKR